jgi:hypothetical protein
MVETQFQRVAALEDPCVVRARPRAEHPSQQSVECHLPPQALKVDAIATRPLDEARLKGGAKRAG